MDIDTLDLHGIKHHQVDRLVENFVLLNQLPVRIIIGNSTKMADFTQQVLQRHGLKWHPENSYNLGSWIVRT